MENEFGKEVEKEMTEEEISEEETKIDLNEENQDIVDKIPALLVIPGVN